ncbi:hypothetical protein [Bacillus suaedae]|uniref:Uncharacterized protein n=1 Tax=Halalkalibacter suaedae TaxID=2822140 RepID=A0A941AP91_9BACI|nr:hypothetical protein [Bacillus suaedae]MBP3951237.1 hypothetical protein [Bacillus suaedae]
MWLIMLVLIFIFTIGVTIGGLLAAPKDPPRPIHLFLFSLFFSILCYIGMLAGMFLTGWIGFRFIEIILSIFALLFIVASISRYHPTFGFFHPEDKVVLLVLAVIFFLIGFEYGLLEMRTFFTLTAGVIFTAALAFGLFIQIRFLQMARRSTYISFIPLVWLLFVTVIKLL